MTLVLNQIWRIICVTSSSPSYDSIQRTTDGSGDQDWITRSFIFYQCNNWILCLYFPPMCVVPYFLICRACDRFVTIQLFTFYLQTVSLTESALSCLQPIYQCNRVDDFMSANSAKRCMWWLRRRWPRQQISAGVCAEKHRQADFYLSFHLSESNSDRLAEGVYLLLIIGGDWCLF